MIDLERLFRLRLAIARLGEMDLNKWWNTNGVLGARGPKVYSRGFPRTHHFTQARVVFAVARSRAEEVFDPPGCMTLWKMPAEIEDQFEDAWQDWLDRGDDFLPLFEKLENVESGDVTELLRTLDLISEETFQAVEKLKRSAESKAVQIPGTFEPNDDVVAILAAAFSKGELGRPAIPYARLDS